MKDSEKIVETLLGDIDDACLVEVARRIARIDVDDVATLDLLLFSIARSLGEVAWELTEIRRAVEVVNQLG